MPHKQPNPDPSTQTLFTLFRKSNAVIQSLIQQQASNSFTCPHQNQTSPSSSSDDQTRGAGLYESYAWMYLRTCLCVCMYVFLSSSCSIIHPFSAVGNRHRFMACDCAMSGFIRTTEGKLTRATKGLFCLYLISMKLIRTGWMEGKRVRREVFIKGSRQPPGVSHLHLTDPEPAGPPPCSRLIWNCYKKMSLLICANVSSSIQMHRALTDKSWRIG